MSLKQEWRRAQRDLAPWEIEEMERYYADKVASKDGYDSMSYGGYDRGGDMDSVPLRSAQPPSRRAPSSEQPMSGHSYALQPLPPLPQRVQERNYDHSFNWAGVVRGFLIALIALVVVGGGGYTLRQWWISTPATPRVLPAVPMTAAAPATVASTAAAPAVTWEYKVVAPSDGEFLNTLNVLGAQGWELVHARRAMNQLDSGASQEVYEMILKRSRK